MKVLEKQWARFLFVVVALVGLLSLLPISARAEGETRPITITKVWQDDGNLHSTRPEDVSVTLDYQTFTFPDTLPYWSSNNYLFVRLSITGETMGGSGSQSFIPTFVRQMRRMDRDNNIDWNIADLTDEELTALVNQMIATYMERFPDANASAGFQTLSYMKSGYTITLPDGAQRPVYYLGILQGSYNYFDIIYGIPQYTDHTISTVSTGWDKTSVANTWTQTLDIPAGAVNLKLWETVPAGYSCPNERENPLPLSTDSGTLTNTLIRKDINILKDTVGTDASQSFSFRIKAENGAGHFYDFPDATQLTPVAGEAGVYSFSVTSNDSAGVTIPGIPYGYTYEITEEPAEGWVLYSIDEDPNATSASDTVGDGTKKQHVFANTKTADIVINKTASGESDDTFTFRFKATRERLGRYLYYLFYSGEYNEHEWLDLNGETHYTMEMDGYLDFGMKIGSVPQAYPRWVMDYDKLYLGIEQGYSYVMQYDATSELPNFLTESTAVFDQYYKTHQIVTIDDRIYTLYALYPIQNKFGISSKDFYVLLQEDNPLAEMLGPNYKVEPAYAEPFTETFTTDQSTMTAGSDGSYTFTIATSGGSGSFTIEDVPYGYTYELWEQTKSGWELVSIDGDTTKTDTQDDDTDTAYSKVSATVGEQTASTPHAFVNKKDSTVVTYTVDFDGNGGEGQMTSRTVDENSSFTLPANGFTAPTDKEFDQWEVTIGTNAPVKKDPNDTVIITANTTVKALWKDTQVPVDPTYTVTVITQGNGTASASVPLGPTGTAVRLTATPASGYRFLKWMVLEGIVHVTDDAFTIGSTDVTIQAVL